MRRFGVNYCSYPLWSSAASLGKFLVLVEIFLLFEKRKEGRTKKERRKGGKSERSLFTFQRCKRNSLIFGNEVGNEKVYYFSLRSHIFKMELECFGYSFRWIPFSFYLNVEYGLFRNTKEELGGVSILCDTDLPSDTIIRFLLWWYRNSYSADILIPRFAFHHHLCQPSSHYSIFNASQRFSNFIFVSSMPSMSLLRDYPIFITNNCCRPACSYNNNQEPN